MWWSLVLKWVISSEAVVGLGLFGHCAFPGWNVWARGTGPFTFFFKIYLFISCTGSWLLRGLSPVGLSWEFPLGWCVAFTEHRLNSWVQGLASSCVLLSRGSKPYLPQQMVLNYDTAKFCVRPLRGQSEYDRVARVLKPSYSWIQSEILGTPRTTLKVLWGSHKWGGHAQGEGWGNLLTSNLTPTLPDMILGLFHHDSHP